jgi:eukaryotic-like serine/threonine-protein kinase
MSLKSFIFSKLFLKNLALAVVMLVGFLMLLLIWLNFYTRHGQSRRVPSFIGLTLQQTERTARKSRMRYQISDSVYTTLVPKGCIAEQNPKPGFRVKKGRSIILTINAFNPEMVAMPNLVNLPKRQALALIEGAGLEIGTLRYIPDISIDVVINQLYNGRDIAEGDSIQKGSIIDLVLGKGLSNQRTAVPDLIGLSLESAVNKILGASLNLGTFIYDNTIVNREDTVNAFVFKQNPEFKADASLQLGSSIYLWLTVDSAKIRNDSTSVSLDTVSIAGQDPGNPK